MSYADLFWHFAGLLAPALVLAPGMVLASRLLRLRPAGKLGWWAQVGINLAVCVTVLVAGLVVLGHDGRITTYAALMLASAACQIVLTRKR